MAHWRDLAACKGQTDLFFCDDRGAPTVKAVQEAKALCNACPVQLECLEYALTASSVSCAGHQDYERQLVGIWGGMTRRERGRLQAQRKAGKVSA